MLLVAIWILVIISINSETSMSAVAAQSTFVDPVECAPRHQTTVLTPAVIQRNCRSWVTAIDVSANNSITMAIKSQKGSIDNCTIPASPEEEIEIHFMNSSIEPLWQIKMGTIAATFRIQEVAAIRIGYDMNSMMLGIDANDTLDESPVIILAYLDNIQEGPAQFTRANKYKLNGLKLPSNVNTIDINVGHTIGLYKDKMFFVAWPTKTGGTYKSVIGMEQSSTLTKLLQSTNDPQADSLSLQDGLTFDKIPCLSCAMATFDHFNETNQKILVAGIEFTQSPLQQRHYISIIDVNAVTDKPATITFTQSLADESSIQVLRVQKDNQIEGDYDHAIGVCGTHVRGNKVVGYVLKMRLQDDVIDYHNQNQGFTIAPYFDIKLYCKDLAFDTQNDRVSVLVAPAHQLVSVLVTINYDDNKFKYESVNSQIAMAFNVNFYGIGAVQNTEMNIMYSLFSLYKSNNNFTGYVWGGSVKSWQSDNIANYQTAEGHAYLMVSDISVAYGKFPNYIQKSQPFIPQQMTGFSSQLKPAGHFSQLYRELGIIDVPYDDVTSQLVFENIDPVNAPNNFTTELPYDETMAQADFEDTTDSLETAEQNQEIEFELPVKTYCAEMAYSADISSYENDPLAPQGSTAGSNYPTITFQGAVEHPDDSTFRLKFKVTFTQNSQAGNWTFKLNATKIGDASISLVQLGQAQVTVPYIPLPPPLNKVPFLSRNYGPIVLHQTSDTYSLKINKADIIDPENDTLSTRWQISPLNSQFFRAISDLELQISPSMDMPVGTYSVVFAIKEVNTTWQNEGTARIQIVIEGDVVEEEEDEPEEEVFEPVVVIQNPVKVEVVEKDTRMEQLKMLIPKEDKQVKKERTPPITLAIRLIDQIGHVFIEFSENLIPVDEFSGLNATVISNDLFFNVTYDNMAESVSNDEESDSGSSISTLEGWNVVNFTKREMIVKLNFSNPSLVSSTSDRDTITIEALVPTIFKAQSDSSILLEKNALIKSMIPLQMQSEEQFYITKASVTSSRNSMDLGILFTLLIQLFFSVSMHLIWGIINALQLVTNLKRMERLQIPGRVILLLETIDGTVNIRIHEQAQVKSFLQEYLNGILSIIDSIGFVFFALIILVTTLAIVIVLQRILKKYEKAQNLMNTLKAKLMWSSVLRALFQGFFILTLATSGHLFGEHDDGGIVDYGLSDQILDSIKLVILISFPVGIAIFMLRWKTKLPTEEFMLKYGTVYGQVRVESKASDMPLWHPTIFLIKRLLIAIATAAFNPQHNQMLISVYVFLQVFNLSYVIGFKPMNAPYLNILEGLNETFVLVTAYLMILFTDFIPEIDTRTQLGDIFYNFIFGVLGLNVIIIICVITFEMFKKARRWWRHKQAKRAEEAKVERQRRENEEEMSGDRKDENGTSSSITSSSSSITSSSSLTSSESIPSSSHTSNWLSSSYGAAAQPVAVEKQGPGVRSRIRKADVASRGQLNMPRQSQIPQQRKGITLEVQGTTMPARQMNEQIEMAVKKKVEKVMAKQTRYRKQPSVFYGSQTKKQVGSIPVKNAPIPGKIRNLADYVNFKRSMAEIQRLQSKKIQIKNSSLPEISPRFADHSPKNIRGQTTQQANTDTPLESSRFKSNPTMNPLALQHSTVDNLRKKKQQKFSK